MASPMKRKLRSTKSIIRHMNIKKKSTNELGKECGNSSLKNVKSISSEQDSDLVTPRLNKDCSPKEKELLNSSQTVEIDELALESTKCDINCVQSLHNDPVTSVNVISSKFEDRQINSHTDKTVFKKNTPKTRSPRKIRGTSTTKIIPIDLENKLMTNISSDKSKATINNSNSLSEDFAIELEESNIVGSQIKESSEGNEQCSTIKNTQKQILSKISTPSVTPKSVATRLRVTGTDMENTGYSCEIANILSNSNNMKLKPDRDNVDDKKNSSQEFNANKLPIKNVINITPSQEMKIDLSNESALKILKECDNKAINGIDQKKETSNNATLTETERISETVELDHNLKIEKLFTDTPNIMLKIKNTEKQSEDHEKTHIVDRLEIETLSGKEQWKSYLVSNKLVTVKINPSNTNNYLLEKEERKGQRKTPTLIKKGSMFEKTNSTFSNVDTAKVNDSLELELDSLNETVDNTNGFNRTISKENNLPIITDLTTEGSKLHVTSSLDNSTRHSPAEIDIIDSKLGIDGNSFKNTEIEEPLIKNKIVSHSESEKLNDLSSNLSACIGEDHLEITEVFGENLINSTLRENILASEVSINDQEATKLIGIETNNKSEETKPNEKPLKKGENELVLFSPRVREKNLTSPRRTVNKCLSKEINTTPTKCNQSAEYLEHNDDVDVQNKPIENTTSNRISRRSAFNKKLHNTENVLPKREIRKPSDDDKCTPDRLSKRKRRKSINDLDVDTDREQYRYRLRRSKSVVPSALNSKKKLNDSDDTKMMRKNDDVVVDDKIKVAENKSRLVRSKSFSHGTTYSRNRNVARDSVSNDNLKKNIENAVKKKSKEVKRNMSQESIGTTNTKENVAIRNIDQEDEGINFQVGDLAWAQIGSHPFWPCLVMEEPETGIHKKTVNFQGKRNQKVLYHVRFFGDNGRRAWINKQQMMLYSDCTDLKTLSVKMKDQNKSPTILQAYIIKPNKLRKWECAVDEAERLKSKSRQQKLSFFIDMFASRAEKKQKQLLLDESESTNSEPSVKRKRKEGSVKRKKTLDSSNTDSQDEGSPVRKKFKKNILTETTVSNESVVVNVPKKDDEVDNANKIENIENDPQQNESLLSRLRLRKQIDEISEIDSKTSSDNNTDVTLYSMAFQKALFKRNNLLRGVSRDKVCQYCYKPEAVIKCKGRCNGSYHVDCATKILQEKLDRKKKDRNLSHSSTIVQENDSDNKNKDVSAEECKNTKEEIIEHPKNENKLELLDDQVQIITVPSSVYNTPPRKTFPPNFKNMSLAEQIDYKMKEIMKKFESKTFYSESTDSSSEENSLIQPLVKATKKCEAFGSTFDDESKTNLGEEKQIQIAKNEPLPEKPSTSSIVEIAVDKGISVKNPTSVIKQKLSIAHVTADFVTFDSPKSDIMQDDNSNVTESVDTVKTVNPKNFKCGFCISDLDPFCFICNQSVSKRGSSIRQKCSLYQCGRFYHPHCLKMWPQTQWSLIQTTKHKDSDEAVDSFVCPLHVCHTCASDDPRAATSRCSGDKIVKCLRCPSTYHSTNLCVPAGTTILSSTQIICPRHREKSKSYTINTTWCFLCSEGGNLICCETCPTSVHPECLPVNLTDDDKFICEDCESGRLPLYDEIVWVKLGKFRWWPALILFPNEIPSNIMNIKHTTGEFVVKFFGTYDHYWVNRGRSFLFQEGDTGHCNSTKKKVDAAFNTAVEEAVVAHTSKKEFKLSQEAESLTSLKPPPYIRIKVNKPVGNVRQLDLDLSSTNACECDPSQPNPCGPDSDCLNRLLLTECSPDVCPAGKRCKNQSFDKREYPPLIPYKTQGRGWGLKTLAPIKKGQFVIEYVGEMIDIEEYQRRIVKMHEQKEENYYFLTIDKDRMLDAGPKGNVARFMNHCCQPNCETQKWTVNGDTRVGLFATEDISADTELTFNYNLECVGKEKKVCRCGAPNCSGFIGVKAKQDTDSRKPKKSYKKKKPEEPIILPPCFICGKKGKVGICNNKLCNNAYHLKCLKLTEWPEGNKFICPWHNCNICSKRTIRCCVKCVNSFCPSHSEGNVRYDNLLGFVCNNHDPIRTPNGDEPVKLRKKKINVITDESAVTSTTSDDPDDKDDIPLILRKVKNKRRKKEVQMESESDNDFEVNKSLTSTPYKKQTVCSDNDSQDESIVSSATLTDVEEIVVKRKRGRPRKDNQIKKKLKKLSNIESHESTASSSFKDDNRLRKNSNCELNSSHNDLENR